MKNACGRKIISAGVRYFIFRYYSVFTCHKSTSGARVAQKKMSWRRHWQRKRDPSDQNNDDVIVAPRGHHQQTILAVKNCGLCG
jgi:uncharacterized protein YfaQ (DUF2300 family)